MRKIINGRLYDTDTAVEVYSADLSFKWDETHMLEHLYKKQSGEYFIFRELFGDKDYINKWIFFQAIVDEPALFFMRRISDKDMLDYYRLSADYQFEPLSAESAKLWMELYASVDDYEKEFELPKE